MGRHTFVLFIHKKKLAMKNLIQNLNRAMFVAILVNLQVEAQVVTVYSGANRGGTSRNFTTAGDYTLTDWDVKSIAIQNGYIVQMANEGGCTGICTYIRNESGSERGILGARGCSIKILRNDATNARLECKLITGDDDLRKGSSVIFQCLVNGVGTRSTRTGPIGSDPGIPNGGSRSLRLNIPGTHPGQVLDCTLKYRSGSSGVPFETTDNWNINNVIITYSSNTITDPIIIYKGKGNPLCRFTAEKTEFKMPVANQICN